MTDIYVGMYTFPDGDPPVAVVADSLQDLRRHIAQELAWYAEAAIKDFVAEHPIPNMSNDREVQAWLSTIQARHTACDPMIHRCGFMVDFEVFSRPEPGHEWLSTRTFSV